MVTGTKRCWSSHTWVMPTFSPTIALLAMAGFLFQNTRTLRPDSSRAERSFSCAAAFPDGRPRTSIGEPIEHTDFVRVLRKPRRLLDSRAMHEGSRTAILAAFLANLGIAAAKLVAFGFTGAASMLAEAVHSVADTGNQGLLMLGGRRATRVADESHPFGHGRERYFWAFVVAVVLFTLGSGFATFEGIEKLLNPHELESPGWAVGTLLVAVVLESFSLRTALRESKQGRGSMSIPRYVRATKSPELPVVLLEDIGALIGLGLALVGIGLAVVTDNPRFDALGSVGIGL